MIAVPEALPGGIPRKEISFFTNDYNYNMGLAEYERILYASQSEGQLGLDCTQNQILFRTAAHRVKSAFSGKKVGIMSICVPTYDSLFFARLCSSSSFAIQSTASCECTSIYLHP